MRIIYFIYNIFLFCGLKFKKVIKTTERPTPSNCRTLLWGSADETDGVIPRIIWTYWSGNSSHSADACLASIVHANPNFTINVLNDENLHTYLPDFPDVPADLCIQLVSDLIRLSLLKKYGGIWVDHSIVVSHSLEWILDAAMTNKAEIVCFYNEHPSAYKSNQNRPIIENGFIASAKGSSFVTDWLSNFSACIFSNNWMTYYKEKANFNELTSNFRKNSLKRASYYSCYIAAQETMLRSNNYRTLFINVEDEFYFYEFAIASLIKRTTLIDWILMRDEPPVTPKLIKLRKMHRHVADACIRFKLHSHKSILGKYLDQKI